MKYKTLKLILADNILKIRNERGYSQEDLANLAGINRIYPGMIERNIRRILEKQIRRHREAAKLSQDKLAKLVGFKWSYIASVERGSNIPVTKLEIIAGGLGVQAYALITPCPGIRGDDIS
jgi:transcriptional regulator with XRE-family HTH domain